MNLVSQVEFSEIVSQFHNDANRGIDDNSGSGKHGKRNSPLPRKERRKAERIQKKARESTPWKGLPDMRSEQQSSYTKRETRTVHISTPRSSKAQTKAPSEQHKPLKSIMKPRKTEIVSHSTSRERDTPTPSPPPRPNLSQSTKDKLLTDDAEIAALEKALGLKRSGILSKAFKDDGLDTLLDGLEDSHNRNVSTAKRKRTEEEAWLEKKRHKARRDRSRDLKGKEETVSTMDHEDESHDAGTDDNSSISEIFDEADESGFSSEGSSSTELRPQRARENPYRAPLMPSNDIAPSKYIPPSLRVKDLSLAEDLSPLRRQLQGLLNRLSEANLLTILGEVERLYQNNARQNVSTVLIDLILGLLSDPTILTDTFIILYGGFIAAVYKIVGTEFGAQAIQRIDEEFVKHYSSEVKVGDTGKKCANLINLLAEMYNFQVIGSNLIYDFIRLCLEDLSETSAELVLKIVRSKSKALFLGA